jgi:hypothetical protein
MISLLSFVENGLIKFNFFVEYGLQGCAVLSTFLSFVDTFTCISFLSSGVNWGFCQIIYSVIGLEDCVLQVVQLLTRLHPSISCRIIRPITL